MLSIDAFFLYVLISNMLELYFSTRNLDFILEEGLLLCLQEGYFYFENMQRFKISLRYSK